jgi:hypothetical protein
MRYFRNCLVSLGLAFACSAGAAEPTPDTAQARADQLRTEADRRFEAGDYAGALQPLLEGYALTHDARFLFNVGVTYHSLGSCELARQYYDQYLLQDPRGAFVDGAHAALQSLAPVCPAAAVARGEPAAATESTRAPVAIGAPVRTTPAAEPSNSGNWLAWSFSSAGGVALVVAGVAGARWAGAAADYANLVASSEQSAQSWDECCAARGHRLEAREAHAQSLTLALGAASLLLAGTGAALWWFGTNGEVTVAVHSGGGGLAYGVQF